MNIEFGDKIILKLGRFAHENLLFIDGLPVAGVARIEVLMTESSIKREVVFGDPFYRQSNCNRLARVGFDVFIVGADGQRFQVAQGFNKEFPIPISPETVV